jgi:hypothetical protein
MLIVGITIVIILYLLSVFANRVLAGNEIMTRIPNLKWIQYEKIKEYIPSGTLFLAKKLKFEYLSAYGASAISNAVWTHLGMVLNYKGKPYILSIRPPGDTLKPKHNLFGNSDMVFTPMSEEVDRYRNIKSVIAIRLPKHSADEPRMLDYLARIDYTYMSQMKLICNKFMQYFIGIKQRLFDIDSNHLDIDAHITCAEFTGELLKAIGFISPLESVHHWEPTDYSSERNYLDNIYTKEIRIK